MPPRPGTIPFQPAPPSCSYVISVAAELTARPPADAANLRASRAARPARTGGGSRRYSQRDIDRLRRIQELTESGLNLAGVKRVMELEDEVARLRAQINQLAREAREAVERTHRQYRRDLPGQAVARPVQARGRLMRRERELS